MQSVDLDNLANNIKAWGKSLGFQQVGIADIDVSQHQQALLEWIDKGYHGQMSFFERNIEKRLHPEQLLPGTLRVISVRMDYLPEDAAFASTLEDPKKAYISRYALGRDYHKVMRKRLKQLAEKIQAECADLEYRPFVDSAPVLEHALAEKAGIGWTGKHSLTLNKDAGSWFFLGELFVNIPLPVDTPISAECGSCSACISICPTNAIVAPYTVDARRCISYLTIEHEGAIPEVYREAIGNRIYGCDDCQLACPFNREAEITSESDFSARSELLNGSLLDLFRWSETEFLKYTEGSAIRRIGIKRWRRNISIAMGNAPFSKLMLEHLESASDEETDEHLLEHYQWAIRRLREKRDLANEQILVTEITRQQARLVRVIKKGLPRDA